MGLSRETWEWLVGLLQDRDDALKFVGSVAARRGCCDLVMAVMQELRERIVEWEDLADQIVIRLVHDDTWWETLWHRDDSGELLYDLFAHFIVSWCKWDANCDLCGKALMYGQRVLAESFGLGVERDRAMGWAKNVVDMLLCDWEQWDEQMVDRIIEMSSVLGCETAREVLHWKYACVLDDERYVLRLIDGFLTWNERYGWESDVQEEIRFSLERGYMCKAGQALHRAGRYVGEYNHIDLLEHVLRYVVGKEVKE